ncbi:helix-turn-helix domain-containing protein [Kitasatospora sp. NPDC088391]|uniref:helix-turn-helix domain-containing protein n=1 Tax=Kitasatospora sp. NPDC088391 TaxID=3364074 RepID=UPI0037F6E2BC
MSEDQEIDGTSSPALRFGEEFRRSRRARGWSQTDVGARMGYSGGLLSYVERGKKPVTLNLAVKADQVFGTGERFQQLWRQYSNASLLEGFAEFVAEEARCRRLRIFGLGLVPGLFQTPAYASAIAAAAVQRGSINEEQADARVALLANRQTLLDRPSPPFVHVVLDESCLRRPVGGNAVMAEQLNHLEGLAARPGITVQTAPFDLGERAPFTMPLMLLDLPDRVVVGYAESQARSHLERTRDTVATWSREYDLLQVEALSTVASLAMIRAVRKELS